MIVIKLRGGLGNQIFQYAFGKAMAKRYGKKLKFDIRLFKDEKYISYKHHNRVYKLDYFKTKVDETTRFEQFKIDNLSNFLSYSYFNENGIIQFQEEVLQQKGDVIVFEGFWQSARYFDNVEADIRSDLKIKVPLEEQYKQYEDLIKRNSNVACLHVRRGDYVNIKQANKVHGTCSISYYQKGVQYIKDNSSIDQLLIFSDDIPWCKEHLQFDIPTEFVEVEKSVDINEMYLMSKCRHFIIANSSFSWWGAWLSQSPGKVVIAPKKWFLDSSKDPKDVIPEEWVKL